MPFSFDPQPEDNETQCARCGAIFHIDLTRCPECGINLYEPNDGYEDSIQFKPSQPKSNFISKISDFMRRVSGRPHSAEEIFGNSLDQALLYDDFLRKVGGDKAIVERLVEYEKQQIPTGNRFIWLQNALQRWEHDNKTNP